MPKAEARPPWRLTMMKMSFAIARVVLLFAVGAVAFHAVAAGPLNSRWDVTHGDIRVVLMSVGQSTVLPNEKDHARHPEPLSGRKEAVPCFTVTALVEALGDKPLTPVHSLEVQIFSGGKPLALANLRGAYRQTFDYHVFQDFLDFSKPEVTNPKRAFVLRYVDFGALPKLQPVTLKIKAGFGNTTETFEFNSVPLQ